MEMILCADDKLFLVPGALFSQAQEAKKRAQDRRIHIQDRENRTVSKFLIAPFT